MGFFRKSPVTTDVAAGVDSAQLELLKDSLAAMLRTLGQYALPTSQFSDEAFRDKCEALALEVLINKVDRVHEGETAGEESPASPPERRSTEQVHRDIRRTIRQQRKVESTEYRNHRESAHVIVENLVTSLRKGLSQKEDQDKEMAAMLEQIEEVVSGGDIVEIRRVTARAATRIRHIMTSQREQEKQQLVALSDQLRTMREELKEVREELQVDALTEVLNRRALDQALGKMIDIAHASAADLTLYMIDIDHFKMINDKYGHPIGDDVLRAVAKQLIKSFPRKDDLVARFGGEEFVVVCRDVSEEEAYMLGNRARRAIEDIGVATDLGDICATVSVGYGTLRLEETAEELLARADQELYKAKDNGRNRVEPFRGRAPLIRV